MEPPHSFPIYKLAAPIYSPTNSAKILPFLHILTNTFGLLKWHSGKESTGNARDTRDSDSIFGFGLLQEDLLEKEMTTHYSILAWEIP